MAASLQRSISAASFTETSFSEGSRSEEHTSELQSLTNLVCRLLLEKKKNTSRHSSRNSRRIELETDTIVTAENLVTTVLPCTVRASLYTLPNFSARRRRNK